jgi:DNA-binding transcriptional regulator PaaX
MGLKKYKYYFKKPGSEIAKDIIYWLLMAGAIYIAAGSPSFARNIIRYRQKWKKYSQKHVYDTFYNLRKSGLLEIRREGKQIHISLTEEGKKKAGCLQINDLKIKTPKEWDRKWRLVIFDITELKKAHREAFRGKLKDLGFCLLQKSVWVHPFDCEAEIELLRDFFGLKQEDLRLIVAEKIGEDTSVKEKYHLN